jgi:hypothetical protein
LSGITSKQASPDHRASTDDKCQEIHRRGTKLQGTGVPCTATLACCQPMCIVPQAPTIYSLYKSQGRPCSHEAVCIYLYRQNPENPTAVHPASAHLGYPQQLLALFLGFGNISLCPWRPVPPHQWRLTLSPCLCPHVAPLPAPAAASFPTASAGCQRHHLQQQHHTMYTSGSMGRHMATQLKQCCQGQQVA